MSEPTDRQSWYHDGLAFTCTRCGACCTGDPGHVWVDAPTIQRLADRLELPVEEFERLYVKMVGDRRSLIERANGDCVFWHRDEGCLVYEQRPIQCRTWPFWRQNIATEAAWRDTCSICPGAGQGERVPIEAITQAARQSHC